MDFQLTDAIQAVRQMVAALRKAGIDLPFPTQQPLFHDQTEATDGDRARQREGWPAGESEVPGRATWSTACARPAKPARRSSVRRQREHQSLATHD